MVNNKQDNFRITNGISKPRHVFVWGINTANIESQTANPFLYNTFSFHTILELFHDVILKLEMEMNTLIFTLNLHTDPSRVFRDVMSYVYANNDFQGGTLLNRSNFENLFPFVYFDLTKQKLDYKRWSYKTIFSL